MEKLFYEFCGIRAQGLEAILDGTIADGYCQMGFPAAGLAVKNQRAPLGDEFGPEVGTEQGRTQCRLQTEVELLNGLEEGEMGLRVKRCKRVCLG